jgi:proline iminopeptidase
MTRLCTIIAACGAIATARAQSSPRPALATGVHEVVLNGVRLWYRVAGNTAPGAPTVVYLHGGPGYNSYSFSVLIGPRLERALRMVYVDQRGSGRSERPWTGHYQIDTLVADVDALRQSLGPSRIAIIGHSFGGTVALEYAARYPEHLSRMVLVSAFSDHAVTCREQRARATAAYPDAFARVAADTVDSTGRHRSDCEMEFQALSQEQFMQLNNTGQFVDSTYRVRQDSIDGASGLSNTGEIGRALAGAGLYDRYQFTAYSRLTMPVLVVAGRHDGAVGLTAQENLARLLPHARLIVYERSAHFPYVEEPEHFARDVTTFLTAAH